MRSFNVWMQHRVENVQLGQSNPKEMFGSQVPIGKTFIVPAMENRKYLKIQDPNGSASQAHGSVLCVDLSNYNLMTLRNDLRCYLA